MDPRRQARHEPDWRKPDVAEDDPDASVRDPQERARRSGLDIPHAEDVPDDAEGAGGRGQPAPGLAKETAFQPGGSPAPRRARRAPEGGPGQDSHEGD